MRKARRGAREKEGEGEKVEVATGEGKSAAGGKRGWGEKKEDAASG